MVGRPKHVGSPAIFAGLLTLPNILCELDVGRPKHDGRPKLWSAGRPKYIGRPRVRTEIEL